MGKKLLSVYESVENLIAGIGLVMGVGIMFVGVVARYVFKHPLTFVDEIGPIFIVWSTLVGYSIAQRNDDHIKMDILYMAVKPPVKRLLDLFSYICGAVFSLFMMVYGFLATRMQFQMNRVTQILEFPVWIAYLIIPFIGCVLVIRFVRAFVNKLKSTPPEVAAETGETESGKEV